MVSDFFLEEFFLAHEKNRILIYVLNIENDFEIFLFNVLNLFFVNEVNSANSTDCIAGTLSEVKIYLHLKMIQIFIYRLIFQTKNN